MPSCFSHLPSPSLLTHTQTHRVLSVALCICLLLQAHSEQELTDRESKTEGWGRESETERVKESETEGWGRESVRVRQRVVVIIRSSVMVTAVSVFWDLTDCRLTLTLVCVCDMLAQGACDASSTVGQKCL